jgi:(p)ppGpp synthase/HD superfamily hydrolase
MIDCAWKIALEAHDEQTYGGTSVPYYFHLADVAYELICRGHGSCAVSVGILHDTVEDTSLTLDDLSKNFPAPVILGVKYMTFDPKTLFVRLLAGGDSEGKRRLQMQLAMKNLISWAVKHADSTCNLGATASLPDEGSERHRLKYSRNLDDLSNLPGPRAISRYIRERFAGCVALDQLLIDSRIKLRKRFECTREKARESHVVLKPQHCLV